MRVNPPPADIGEIISPDCADLLIPNRIHHGHERHEHDDDYPSSLPLASGSGQVVDAGQLIGVAGYTGYSGQFLTGKSGFLAGAARLLSGTLVTVIAFSKAFRILAIRLFTTDQAQGVG